AFCRPAGGRRGARRARPLPVHLQAVLASDHPGVPHRHRAARAHRADQEGARTHHPPLPLALRRAPARGQGAPKVNWLSIEIHNARGKLTYRNSFIPDLPVTRENVADLADCARARWKIENETFNVLKNGGYHLEHNFGHGKQHLSALLACFNLLAFAIHTVCDLAKGAWRHARETLGPRTRFFHNL